MRLGITGHRSFADADQRAWVHRALRDQLAALDPTRGFTSLAVGADQMFAEALLDLSVPYEAIVPCAEYETTFSTGERPDYERLLAAADRVVVLGFGEVTDEAFFAGGQAVLDACDVLVTVWDGLPPRGRGGTGEIVRLAQDRGKAVLHLHPESASVRRL